MCGIFGFVVKNTSNFDPQTLNDMANALLGLSESRGKDSAGVAFDNGQKISVYKVNGSASRLIKSKKYKKLSVEYLKSSSNITLIGHTRMTTNGSQDVFNNNQPVIAGSFVGIHNGIIVNEKAIWDSRPDLKRNTEVDSEVIFALLDKCIQDQNNIQDSFNKTYSVIDGVASIATISSHLDNLILATNNGSLYYLSDMNSGCFLFASERFILKEFLNAFCTKIDAGFDDIVHLKPNQIARIDQKSAQVTVDQIFKPVKESDSPNRHSPKSVTLLEPDPVNSRKSFPQIIKQDYSGLERLFPYKFTSQLKRCTKCVLPETMPFISYDEKGVCNYCREYSRLEFKGLDNLKSKVNNYQRQNRHDCVVGVSGGRDSIYTLHYVKKELNLDPIAYTYDWGMVTDLARRNISRICAKLGIEHILVSADISKKREFVRKNVAAWLKRPALGMIPLFMAGDKQYFYHAQKLKQQTGIDLVILGENMLERTNFKTGFAGIAPETKDKNHVYTLPIIPKIKLASYYGLECLKNLSYLNSSLFDSLYAFKCYYMTDRSYLNLFGYIPWNENEVISTIRDLYDWELAEDTQSTWRIGDGTASFYNYIYYQVAGFTENDTFRSNQIREGIMDRDRALKLVERDNAPRWESIDWYLQTIQLNIDIKDVLSRINTIPKLFQQE